MHLPKYASSVFQVIIQIRHNLKELWWLSDKQKYFRHCQIIRLPLSFKKIRQDWEETDDELDSAASLICDEDLPASDGEDFIETIR